MAVALRLQKVWRALDEAGVAALPGQLGVFQLGDDAGRVVYIGFAGGRSHFGLRSEVAAAAASCAQATCFRYEVNMQYTTRYRELLALHAADFGELPAPQAGERIGRLRPASGGA